MSALRDDRAKLEELDTVILAINPGSPASHKKFAEKEGFTFPLLLDQDRSAAQAYKALKENERSIQRTVVIVDKEGIVRYAKQGMPPDSELLQAVRQLGSQ